jgi:hypothetical protein
MIDKGDIPSIESKTILTELKSMRKVDGLSLIVVDFYVAGLTARLNSTETSLQPLALPFHTRFRNRPQFEVLPHSFLFLFPKVRVLFYGSFV